MPLSLKLTKHNKYSVKVLNHFTQETFIIELGEVNAEGAQLIFHDKEQKYRFDRVYLKPEHDVNILEATKVKLEATMEKLVQERESLRADIANQYPIGYAPRHLTTRIGGLTNKIRKIKERLGHV